MKKSTSNNSDTDYQVGAHEIDETESLSSGELIEFSYESAAIFKRLADDIYDSPEAGIREPIQNAITAIHRAVNEANLDKKEGLVQVKVRDGESTKIVIQDNGIGITRNVLDEVLSVIGRSQNRDDGEVSGKYGMGFLSFYKLVGTNNSGFWMFTNSRLAGTDPIQGIWKPAGFEIDKNGEISSHFDEDEYGTRFELFAKEGISTRDVRGWVERHAEYSRIPISYEEYTKDGSLRINEDYGVSKLSDNYDDGKGFFVQIDNEYFNVISSSQCKGKTILLNSPINRNSMYQGWRRGEAPRRFDIRLKNENGIVVKGPHKGLVPISEAEYSNMKEERKDNYFPETQLNQPESPNDVFDEDVDIALPKPTGTRDTLERNRMFWSYVQKSLREKTRTKLKDHLRRINSPDKFTDASRDEKLYIYSSMDILDIINSDHSKLQSNAKSVLDFDTNEDMCRLFSSLEHQIYMIERGSRESEANRKYGSSINKTKPIQVLLSQEDGEVFMGVSMNKAKMEAVWSSDDKNIVVRVPDSSVYKDFSELFGWKKLRNAKEYISEDEVSDSIIESLSNSNSSRSKSSKKTKPILDREITVHKDSCKTKMQISELEETYKDTDEKLVLFPSNSDLKVSDFYSIVNEHVSIAKCLVKMWENLKSTENIVRAEEFLDNSKSMTFNTTSGKMNVKELLDVWDKTDKDLVFYPVSGKVEKFQEDNIMDSVLNLSDDLDKDSVLVPDSENRLNYIFPLFKKSGNSLDSVYTIYCDSTEATLGTRKRIASSEVYVYAWAKAQKHLREQSVLNALDVPGYSLDDKWSQFVDNYIMSSNKSHLDLVSLSKQSTYKTDKGRMSIKQMSENYKLILVHSFRDDIVPIFRHDNVIQGAKEYAYHNEKVGKWSKNRKASQKVKDLDDIIYVPVSSGQSSHIVSVSDGEVHTIKGSRLGGGGKIPSNTAAYAYARLDDEIYESIVPDGSHSSLESLESGGKELIDSFSV